jgi:hypothetical protein
MGSSPLKLTKTIVKMNKFFLYLFMPGILLFAVSCSTKHLAYKEVDKISNRTVKIWHGWDCCGAYYVNVNIYEKQERKIDLAFTSSDRTSMALQSLLKYVYVSKDTMLMYRADSERRLKEENKSKGTNLTLIPFTPEEKKHIDFAMLILPETFYLKGSEMAGFVLVRPIVRK